MLCGWFKHVSAGPTSVYSALTNGRFDVANENEGLSRAVQKFWDLEQLGITESATETNDEIAMQM